MTHNSGDSYINSSKDQSIKKILIFSTNNNKINMSSSLFLLMFIIYQLFIIGTAAPPVIQSFEDFEFQDLNPEKLWNTSDLQEVNKSHNTNRRIHEDFQFSNTSTQEGKFSVEAVEVRLASKENFKDDSIEEELYRIENFDQKTVKQKVEKLIVSVLVQLCILK